MNARMCVRRFYVFKYIFNQWRGTNVSLFKTLLCNFSAFPLRDALKFPIWVYQNTKIEHIGKIKINAPLHSGMIRFGKRQFFRNQKTTIINIGVMEFDGDCTILGGSTIHVLGENSVIHFGKEVMIGEEVKMLVGPYIEIGDYTRIAFGSLITSADFHYVININSGIVSRSMASIKLGKYNWIGNHTVIKKGVKTPDYCIVSNGSMLTKDYSDQPLYTLIVGVPGKVKGSGFRRVYNDKFSDELDEYFNDADVHSKVIPANSEDLNYDWFCNGDIHVHKH